MKKLELSGISKSYNDEYVLKDFNAVFDNTHVNCIMGASGTGKTTLLNIIMGLVKADKGRIVYNNGDDETGKVWDNVRKSSVFQDSSLVEHLNPVINVSMVLDNMVVEGNKLSKDNVNELIRKELEQLLDKDALDKPCLQLSGGMKRRVEIVRAIMAESDIVVMDEPFAGLDENTKDIVIQYILNNIRERILIITTHDENDIKKLSANVLFIDNNAACCYNNV